MSGLARESGRERGGCEVRGEDVREAEEGVSVQRQWVREGRAEMAVESASRRKDCVSMVAMRVWELCGRRVLLCGGLSGAKMARGVLYAQRQVPCRW